MTNLKAKSQEFIELGAKITQGNWYYCPERLMVSIYKNNDDPIEEGEYVPSTAFDVQAMAHTPEMIAHIKALQAVIDDYEKRVNWLKEKRVFYSEKKWKGLQLAVEIMTGEDE